jgi:hypothetical protein
LPLPRSICVGWEKDASESGRGENLRVKGAGEEVYDVLALSSPGEHGGDGWGARRCRRSSVMRSRCKENDGLGGSGPRENRCVGGGGRKLGFGTGLISGFE